MTVISMHGGNYEMILTIQTFGTISYIMFCPADSDISSITIFVYKELTTNIKKLEKS